MPLHVTATLLGFRVLPFATLFLTFASLASADVPRRVPAVWLALTVALALFDAILAWGPRVEAPSGLVTQVVAQKGIAIITLGALLYLCALADLRARSWP